MQAYFDEWGPEGRRMMSSCASIQVNIDSGDAATLARRWDLAHRIGPAMAATFACSPGSAAPLRAAGRRGTPWTRPAPSRCWPRGGSPRTGPTTCSRPGSCSCTRTTTAASPWRCRSPSASGSTRASPAVGPRWPTSTTTAPRCSRPCVPAAGSRCAGSTASPPAWPRWPAPPSPRCCIDERASEAAIEACAAVDGVASWATTASLGTQDPDLAAGGGRDSSPRPRRRSIARRRRRAGRSPWPTPAERWPAKGRSPADDLEERLAAGATVLDLADPPVEVSWA